MAAIYSGIHQKLNSHLTPWPDKLKLARFAWVSSQCLLPNKEQFLFDWVARALSGYYSKKVEVPQEVVEGLWTFLNEILHSKKLCNVLNTGKTINIHPAVPQMINERILESKSGTLSVNLYTILSCCEGILAFPVLAVTYTAKYELLMELVVKTSGLACFQLQQQESTEPLSVKVFEVLLLVLSTYLTVQRQQGNPRRVFVQVTEHLLQPLCLLRHLITSRTWTEKDDTRIRQQMSKELRSKVDLILQSALFYHEYLQYYKEELLPSQQGSGRKKGSTGKTFLCPAATILSKLAHGHDANKESFFYGVQSSSLALLFKFALDAFCEGGENKLVCFHLMTKFLTALDFTEDLNIKETFNEANWSFALLALEDILNSCLAGDIYNVAADKIHDGVVQLNFYRKVAQVLFNNAQTGIPAWYRCLKILLDLNHQILQPDLDELVSSVWVDADNMELQVKKAREMLICAVLQTYAKLRQLPRLFEELLVVICRPAADELRQELLPEALQKCLGQCLLDNPPSQNLEICRLILEKMQNDLPYIQEGRRESALKMFSLSVLMHAVVFSLKTLDDSTPLPIVRQTQSLMEEMLKFVRGLLQCLEGVLITDNLWVEKIQEASLLLTHTWHEADTLFQIHCSKYTSLDGPTGDVSPISDTVQKVLALRQSGGQVTSPLNRFLQKLLALHRMKRHSLISPSLILDMDTQDVLCETAQVVVNCQELSVNLYTDQTWDRQFCSVNSDTYPVAFWFLVTTNLPLIAPHLTQEVTSRIADTILNSLLQGHSGSNMEETDLSFLLISKQLLSSTVLCELPNLYSAVVTSVTDRFFGLPNASDVQSFCPSFFKSCTEIGAASESKEGRIAEISSSFNRLKAIAQEIMDCAKTGASIPISKTQVDTLLQVVRLTSVLNPCAISPEDYLGLFLGLFFMTLCVQRNENGALSVPVNLLKELFGLMDSLLLGKNSHTILKVVHGSTLLEAAMTSLFSRFDKDLFRSVDSSSWFSFLQSVQAFIHSITHVILERKSSMRINLDKFTTFMIDRALAVGTSSVHSGDCAEALYSFQLHLVTFSTLCNEMMSVLGKSPQLDEFLTQLLGKIISIMGPTTQTALMGKADSGLGQSFSIDVGTVMIKSELATVFHQTQDTGDGDHQHKLSNMTLYNSFGQQIMEEIYPTPQPMEVLISSLHYLSAFYLASEKTRVSDLDSLHFKILQSVYKLLSSAWLSVSEVKELEVPLSNLLNQLMGSSSEEQLQSLFLMIRGGLVASQIDEGFYKDVFATVTVIKLLASCSLSETSSEMFWRVVPHIMSSLVFVVRASGQVSSLTSLLTVPVVETLITLLRQGETHISDPHHVVLVLGALEFVPLENQCMEDYYSAFHTIHEALYAIILYYPKVMLKASPVFLNCFYRLVASVMREGRQKVEDEKGKDSEKLLKCAMLVERMYTHIGTTAESFTVLSSFIVAQYVTELQKVTLRPEIKAHLTEGIYCILDQCVEQDIKFLNRTLQMGVKEVFSELYKSYTHYHKSQRQGEEKYTV
ncbi:unhealthy ribosome biogenesis protein 2 homolog [Ictalurus furcatus]|uniref:unhealthy ribosome biogenesis protein 2 homolog n=1 Tax=Ictalurus furcatus TaxID=66913 RepID=UPI002350B21A|nr:unhealthy ribosome biogenesis protein 2 homolog [Ictalurus furcatus]XP_053477583.1 unhealthy ribosome biogenesis protein 2 homolog [Ictalurus furcatus]